jgi:hypothetical protein
MQLTWFVLSGWRDGVLRVPVFDRRGTALTVFVVIGVAFYLYLRHRSDEHDRGRRP